MEKHDSGNSLHDYSRYWKNKFEVRRKKILKRKKMLKTLAKKCSVLLKKEFNAKKVYLIGSLTPKHRIHENSDIDLVVVGLLDEKYFSALKKLYGIVPNGVNIDLITLETSPKSMKDIIEKIGVII